MYCSNAQNQSVHTHTHTLGNRTYSFYGRLALLNTDAKVHANKQSSVNAFSEVQQFARHGSLSYLWLLYDKVLEMRSITNFILLTIHYPSLEKTTAQFPAFEHQLIVS